MVGGGGMEEAWLAGGYAPNVVVATKVDWVGAAYVTTVQDIVVAC